MRVLLDVQNNKYWLLYAETNKHMFINPPGGRKVASLCGAVIEEFSNAEAVRNEIKRFKEKSK